MVLFACALAGLFAGVLLWVQVLRWLALVYTALRQHGGDFLGTPKRRLIWVTPFVALLHPAPWMLVALAYLLYRALATPLSGGWRWFLVGSATGVCLQGATTLLAMLRLRRSGASISPERPGPRAPE